MLSKRTLLLIAALLTGCVLFAEPPAPNRVMYASVVHEGDLFLLGGWDGRQTLYNDVLRSPDGITWQTLTPSARWQPRSYFSAVSFEGRIILVGGFVYQPPDNTLGDIWASQDGVDWTELVHDAPFEDREHYGLVVFKDQLLLLGGVTYLDPDPGANLRTFGDVWISPDGQHWTLASANAFPARRGFGVGVLGDYVYIWGGFDSRDHAYRDVWRSSDGAVWELVTDEPLWSGRAVFYSAVWRGRLWMIGGQGDDLIALSEVWSSADGLTWRRETDFPGGARLGANPITTEQGIYIVNGFAGHGSKRVLYQDAWYFDGIKWAIADSVQ